MASTVTLVDKRPTGDVVRGRTHSLRLARADIAFSGTYTTGGEACDFTALDGNLVPAAKIEAVYITCPTLPLFLFTWDSVNKTVVAFSMATGAQLANANAGLAGKTAQALIVLK
jgi:hypothetical protein